MRVLITSIVLSAAALLCSCGHVTAKRITFTHFASGEVLVGEVNTLSQYIKVNMPGGEVLQGKFTLQRSGDAYALLKSPTTTLMLEIRATVSGTSGFGEAQTNDGKRYRVQF